MRVYATELSSHLNSLVVLDRTIWSLFRDEVITGRVSIGPYFGSLSSLLTSVQAIRR